MNALSYPPSRLHKSINLTPEQTLLELQNYIEEAEQLPYFLPNAVLTKTGAIHNPNGFDGGIAMHNLRRLVRGLEGENLGQEEPETRGAKRKRNDDKESGGVSVGFDDQAARIDGGERSDVDIRADEDMHIVAEGEEAERHMEFTDSISKEERKRLKKARKDSSKKDREQKRRKKDS
jgi:hypothetical protein